VVSPSSRRCVQWVVNTWSLNGQSEWSARHLGAASDPWCSGCSGSFFAAGVCWRTLVKRQNVAETRHDAYKISQLTVILSLLRQSNQYTLPPLINIHKSVLPLNLVINEWTKLPGNGIKQLHYISWTWRKPTAFLLRGVNDPIIWLEQKYVSEKHINKYRPTNRLLWSR